MEESAKTFISYSRADAAFVSKLAQDLRKAGADIWLDRFDIPVGQEWPRSVEQALRACGQFMLVLSPASVESTNVSSELNFALERGKLILPVLIQECERPFRIQSRQYADFTGDYAQGLAELLHALGVRAVVECVPTLTKPPTEVSRGRKLAWIAAGVLLLVLAAAIWMRFHGPGATPDGRTGVARPVPLVGENQAATPPRQQETPGSVWTDPSTGLMWAGKDNGSDVNWNEAISYCRNLRLAGHSDWRLSTIDELSAMHDLSKSETFVDSGRTYTYNIKGGIKLSYPWAWSGTQNGSGAAWGFGFGVDVGHRYAGSLGDRNGARALCVRRAGDQ